MGQCSPLQFLSNDPGSFDQRAELAKGDFPRQVFHAAIRGQDQALGFEILQGCTYSRGHSLRRLHLPSAQIQDAYNDGLMCELTEDREIEAWLSRFDRDLPDNTLT